MTEEEQRGKNGDLRGSIHECGERKRTEPGVNGGNNGWNRVRRRGGEGRRLQESDLEKEGGEG